MFQKAIQILACPVDGHNPLKVYVLDRNGGDITEGLLLCEKCGRWYPVENGIPRLTRDSLRFQNWDAAFLARHENRLPSSIVSEGHPVNLQGLRVDEISKEDRLILDEGAYWSEYARVHYDAGDTSFLDVRSRSTHPAFYGLGVLERDEKDAVRQYGMWPNHLSKVIYGYLNSLSPGVVMDVGCGAGQFGLEAAYLGWELYSFDIAYGALEVARDYAIKKGLKVDYIYAEPCNPPFCPNAFDLMMAKDSLHHMKDLERSLNKVSKAIKHDGECLIYDHVGHSPLAEKIRNFTNRHLHPRIQRRYPAVEIPEVFKKESPCEDLGRDSILPLLDKHFHITKMVKEIMLYHELEFPVYYAFGKRLWFSRMATWIMRWFIEKPLLLFQDPEYAIVIGEKKEQ